MADAKTTICPIEIRHVSISFGEKQVLSDVSFKLACAETLVLLGAAGSGKSTLLKLAAGLLKPDSGEIIIDGENIVSLRETELYAIRRRMGIVFQEGAIFDSLSVYENIAYPLRETGKKDEIKIEETVRRLLGFVELEDAIDKMPVDLSGGMRRRVAVARAIAARPAVMLYDSPTAGLDPITAHTINILIMKMRDLQHVSSILVTQRLQDALFLSRFAFSAETRRLVPVHTNGNHAEMSSTRFVLLKDGTVYFAGNREELVKTDDPYVLRFIS
ncbi:MAG: ABC transporter ATP-binding protein [Terriglobia bacterium]